MKKIFGFMLAMCALVLFAGCAKDVSEESNRRIFAKAYIEEYEGEEVEITNVVIFNEDNTGTLAIQDIIPFTYDDNNIMNENGEVMYAYSITDGVLSLTAGDVTQDYVLTDESILEKVPDVE